jgi:hypothetical protein
MEDLKRRVLGLQDQLSELHADFSLSPTAQQVGEVQLALATLATDAGLVTTLAQVMTFMEAPNS